MKLEGYLGEREDYEVRDEYLVKNKEDLKYKVGDTIHLIPIEKLMECTMISAVSLGSNSNLDIAFNDAYFFVYVEEEYTNQYTIRSVEIEHLTNSYYYILDAPSHYKGSSWVDEWMIQPKVTNIQKMLKFARRHNA